MKPLILGEAPSKSGDKYYMFPLSGAVGQRLCVLAGLPSESGGSPYGRYYWPLAKRYELRNLLERYPGVKGRGAAFPYADALEALRLIEPELQGRTTVLLGRRLARLLGAPDEFFAWRQTTPSTWLTAIPHPSGLNRLYDSPEVRESASRVLQEALVCSG